MSKIKPIPSGAYVQSQWDAHKPTSAPILPASWTATVLLSPFGDSQSPLTNYSQLVVGHIESSWTPTESWMRARLYLTQDLTYFDFYFLNQNDIVENCQWYWIDSTPQGSVNHIYGPLTTTLRIPSPTFFSDRIQPGNPYLLTWGNRYPLMCTDTNPKGIDCDHWTDQRNWYAFRRETGTLFRILTMDPTNPLLLPILGSYYIANIPTFRPYTVSDSSQELIYSIREGDLQGVTSDPNPMITQQDIHRAMADPLACARCTLREIQALLPGFIPKPTGVVRPSWPHRLYIEGWTLGSHDAIPYDTRVCYLWTGNADSKQQSVMIGNGASDLPNTPYLVRADACLNTKGSTYPSYNWKCDKWVWNGDGTQPAPPGIPYPNWIADADGEVMGQIIGNPHFGLGSCETLNLIAAKVDMGDGQFSIFWVWFLENGAGVLFSEGSFKKSLDHLQLIDYTLFLRDAPVTAGDFSGPFPAAEAAAELRMGAALGHPTILPRRPRTANVASF
jgi:hypothetical protein